MKVKHTNPFSMLLPPDAVSDQVPRSSWVLRYEAQDILAVLEADPSIKTYSQWEQRSDYHPSQFHQAFCFLTRRAPRFSAEALARRHTKAEIVQIVKGELVPVWTEEDERYWNKIEGIEKYKTERNP